MNKLVKGCLAAMMLVGTMSVANADLIPTTGDLVVGTEYFNSADQSYGVFLGAFTGNDDLTSVITAINASGVVAVDELTLVGKSDEASPVSVIGTGLTGTWTSTVGIDFYTVKAGNAKENNTKGYKSVSVWYVEPTATSGIWTTYGLTNNGENQPTISHLSAFAKPADVPEPSILSLFGLSLLGLGFIRRKKN